LGLVDDLPHRIGENSRVSLLAVSAPTLGAGCKDAPKIELRWASEPKPRHAVLPRAPCSGSRQPFEIPIEIGTIDLDEVAAIERIGASLDLSTEDLELEAVFPPALLECAQGVADGFAGILVFTRFDDLFDKRILLGGQVDIPGRHWAVLLLTQDSTHGKDCQSADFPQISRCTGCTAELGEIWGSRRVFERSERIESLDFTE
jgi:hypothetical protein